MPEPKIPFQKADYGTLDARQQEVYNYHHIAATLARYGYASYPIRDDWNGGDMIARHMVGGTNLVIQIKGRVTFAKNTAAKISGSAFLPITEYTYTRMTRCLISILNFVPTVAYRWKTTAPGLRTGWCTGSSQRRNSRDYWRRIF
jgi:hypothetical protein